MNRPGAKILKHSIIIFVFFLAFSAVLVARLFVLQIVKHEEYLGKVTKQITVEGEVNAERGDIYDRNGNILATNVTVYRVFISPTDIQRAMNDPTEKNIKAREAYTAANLPAGSRVVDEMEFVSHILAQYLNVDYDKVKAMAAKEKRLDETVKRNVDEDTADALRSFVEANGLASEIHFEAGTKRYYCYGNLAADAIGFVSSTGDGVTGIESSYNSYLKGTSGKYIYAKDAKSRDMPFKYESFVDPENGYDLVSTLDMKIQFELETQLQAAYETYGAAKGVSGVVMKVKTGEILAMAEKPDFDLNDPYNVLTEEDKAELAEMDPQSNEYRQRQSEMLYEVWRNKTVTDRYEPGSTSKIITASIAIEEKKVKLDQKFTCYGIYHIEGTPYSPRCHKLEGHGTLTFAEGLQQSCNPTFMETAKLIGKDLFYSYLESYGYTEKTGIDLPSEYDTIITTKDGMGPAELAIYSFGQTYKTTVIQQLTALSAVANGGYLVTPHIMQSIKNSDGNVIESYETKVRRQVISAETSKTLMTVLEQGVSGNGGAKNAYVKGYKVAAKTGTSEKTDQRNEAGETYLRVGSCVAFAPADDPEIAVLFMVDEPTEGSVYGSVVAAPYVSKLLSTVLPYLGYEAEYSGSDAGLEEFTVSNYKGCEIEYAKSDIKYRKVEYEVVGDGPTVTAQVPRAGSVFTKETGKIILYTGGETPKNTVSVPDVTGKLAVAANRLIINSGLNIKISGAANYDIGSGAVVISQSPAAGEKVPKGTVVTVEFRHMDGTD